MATRFLNNGMQSFFKIYRTFVNHFMAGNCDFYRVISIAILPLGGLGYAQVSDILDHLRIPRGKILYGSAGRCFPVCWMAS